MSAVIHVAWSHLILARSCKTHSRGPRNKLVHSLLHFQLAQFWLCDELNTCLWWLGWIEWLCTHLNLLSQVIRKATHHYPQLINIIDRCRWKFLLSLETPGNCFLSPLHKASSLHLEQVLTFGKLKVMHLETISHANSCFLWVCQGRWTCYRTITRTTFFFGGKVHRNAERMMKTY